MNEPKMTVEAGSELERNFLEQVATLSPEANTSLEPETVDAEENQGYEFKGFDIPAGSYKVLLILRPTESGQTPPRVEITTSENDWKTWVRTALKSGLSRGSVLAQDATTVLTGFSATAVGTHDGKEYYDHVAFLFTQVASVIPYKEVMDAYDRRHDQAKVALKSTVARQRVATRRKAMAAKSKRQQRRK